MEKIDKEKLLWTEDSSVKNAVIDEQHRHLFDLANELADEKAANDPYKFVRLPSSPTNYSMIHFSEEEAFMEQHGFSDMEKHKAEYSKFICRVSRFNIEYPSSVPTDAVIVFLYLKSWIVNHVMELVMDCDFTGEKLVQNYGQ